VKETLTTIEKAIFLKELEYFADLPFEQAAAIARIANEVHYEAGTVIFEQGALAEHVYVPIEGSTILEKDGIVLNVLGPGHGFGDLSLVPGATHPLMARAATPLDALQISIADLSDVMLEHPEIALGIVRALSDRLRELGQQMADLNRQLQDGSHAFRLPEGL
jgi:CRP/FNR family transcriptional regulator